MYVVPGTVYKNEISKVPVLATKWYLFCLNAVIVPVNLLSGTIASTTLHDSSVCFIYGTEYLVLNFCK